MKGIWYHGGPATGKTTRAFATAPPELTYVYEGGPWDGLAPSHTTIVIDALTPAVISHRDLCRLLDNTPRFVQSRTGRLEVRATTVVVTCSVGPEEAYEEEANFTEHGAEQLNRRFVQIFTGPEPGGYDSDGFIDDSSSEYDPEEGG